MKKIIYFLAFSIVLVACSSTKQIDEKAKTEIKKDTIPEKPGFVPQLIDFNSGLKNMVIEGEIDIDSPQLDNSANFEMTICGNDSLSMVISGPLGITVAKLFATKDNFVFLNSFQGELYKGKPTSENFQKVANIPLSFNDLIRILQSKLTNQVNLFKYYKIYDNNYVFLNTVSNINDEIIVNKEINKLLYLKRYDSRMKEFFNCSYSDFAIINNSTIAKKITINAPDANIKLKITYEDIKTNVTISKPISFKIPEKIKTFILDK